MEIMLKRPYRSLASAIVLRAFKDLKSNDEEQSADAYYWLVFSEQARFLLDCLGMESFEPLALVCKSAPTKIKKARNKGSYNKTKNKI